MFTDEGFKYLIQAPNAAKKITRVELGSDKDSIVILDPPKSISELQSVITTKDHKYPINASTLTERNFHNGISYSYYNYFYESANVKKNYYEYGIFGDNEALLYYVLNTNSDKTFLSEVIHSFTSGYFENIIEITNPLKNLEKDVAIISEGVLTDYTIIYNTVSYDPKPSLTAQKVMTCNLHNAAGSLLGYGEVVLESYDLITREALINLKVVIDSSQRIATNYLMFSSLFCNLKISLIDPITDEPKEWPLTDGEALIIPLKVSLGEAK